MVPLLSTSPNSGNHDQKVTLGVATVLRGQIPSPMVATILDHSILCQLQIGPCHGHLPSNSQEVKSCAAAADDLQQPLKGVQDESNEALSFSTGKTGRTDLQIVRYLQVLIL